MVSAYNDDFVGFVPFFRRSASVVFLFARNGFYRCDFEFGRVSAGFFDSRFNRS